MTNIDLLDKLIDEVEKMYENSRLDDTEGNFKEGAKDYLIQVLDLLENTKDDEEENNA